MLVRRVLNPFIFGVLAVSVVSPALSQDASIIGELERLRRDMNTLQSFVYRGDKSAPPKGNGSLPEFASQDSVSQVQLQVQELRRRMREMNGQFEEIQFKITRAAERLDRLVTDVDLRLRALEEGRPPQHNAGEGPPAVGSLPSPDPAARGGEPSTTVISSAGAQKQSAEETGLAPGQRAFGVIKKQDLVKFRKTGTVSPSSEPPRPVPSAIKTQPSSALASRPQPTAAPGPSPVTAASSVKPAAEQVAALPPGTAKEQYEFAYNLLMKRDLPGAETALKAFLAKHPEHELADNAIFWLGETHYARKNYQEAIRVYYDAYKTYPKGNKAPAVLLKLGMSLATIGEKESACSAYEELGNSHPNASPRILGNASRASKSLGCK